MPPFKNGVIKGYDESGFSFLQIMKVTSPLILKNKNVALNFQWKSIQRQIRIEGLIDKMNSDESDEYYNSNIIW